MDEVNWPLPNKWQDGVDLATWAPHFKDSYEGPYGGPDIHGPSNTMSELCRISDCISSIFLFISNTTIQLYSKNVPKICIRRLGCSS